MAPQTLSLFFQCFLIHIIQYQCNIPPQSVLSSRDHIYILFWLSCILTPKFSSLILSISLLPILYFHQDLFLLFVIPIIWHFLVFNSFFQLWYNFSKSSCNWVHQSYVTICLVIITSSAHRYIVMQGEGGGGADTLMVQLPCQVMVRWSGVNG